MLCFVSAYLQRAFFYNWRFAGKLPQGAPWGSMLDDVRDFWISRRLTRGQAAGLFEARKEVVRKLSLMWPRLNPHGFPLLIACIGALGSALALVRVLAQGPVMDGDSILYVEAANGLLDGLGFLNITGGHLVLQPPLFPILLTAANLVCLTPLQAAGYVNAAAFGLTTFFGGQWLSQRTASRFLVVWACLAFASAPVVVEIVYRVWSEPTFILFTTLTLLQIDKFLNASKRSSLIWAAAFTALACMTRYVGVALIALALGLLLFQRGTAVREKLKHMAIYATIATAPVGVWLIRNYLLATSPAGPRPLAVGDLSTNAQLVLEGLSEWWAFAATQDLGNIAVGITGVLVLAMCALVGYAFVRWLLAGATSGNNFVVVNGVFVLIYIAFLTTIVTFVGGLRLQNHYLVPIYMPLLFIAVLVIDRILGRCEPKRLRNTFGDRSRLWTRAKQTLPGIVKVALCLWMIRLAHGSLSEALAADARSLRPWQESPTLEQLRRQNPEGRIFNNALPHMRMFYFRDLAQSQLQNYWLPSSKRQLQLQIRKGDHVVYFYDTYRGSFKYGLSGLRGLPELETVGEFADGVIFKAEQANRDGGGAQRTATSFVALSKPVIRSYFDLHIRNGELIYAKAPCIPADVRTRFFLHLFPSDIDDPAFPEERRRHGFDNLDFDFDRWGTMLDGTCVATRRLPGYDIARIATGQYVPGPGHRVWSADFVPNPQ